MYVCPLNRDIYIYIYIYIYITEKSIRMIVVCQNL